MLSIGVLIAIIEVASSSSCLICCRLRVTFDLRRVRMQLMLLLRSLLLRNLLLRSLLLRSLLLRSLLLRSLLMRSLLMRSLLLRSLLSQPAPMRSLLLRRPGPPQGRT